MITILEAKRAGQFGMGRLLPNIVAGVIVGVVALLGGSRVQIAGPTGAFTAILAGVTAKYGIDGLRVAKMGAVLRRLPDDLAA